MIPEDGTGLSNADTYVDPLGSFAVGYVAASLYADVWTAADDARKTAAVIQATRTLDALFTWHGCRLTLTQALDFPRYYATPVPASVPLPVALQMATMEMAFALLERNRTSDTSSGSAPIASLGLGDGALEIKFGADPTTVPITEANMVPPFVVQLLYALGYLTRNKPRSGMVRIERR